MSKVAIYSPSGAIPEKHNSHRSAWVHMRVDQMKRQRLFTDADDDGPAEFVLQPKSLDGYDDVIIYNGMEMDLSSPAHPVHSKQRGSKAPPLNMFGGLPPNWSKYQALIDYPGRLHFLDFSIDYADLIRKRKDAEPYYARLVKLQQRLEDLPVIDQPLLNRLVIGDSHAISSYVPGSTVIRCDFMTLLGMIKRGLSNVVEGYYPDYEFDHIYCNFGNIDLRHHLCRKSDPIGAAKLLATMYVRHLSHHYPATAREVIELMPVESADRKVPTTGWFKGTPFYGNTDLRRDVRRAFNEQLRYTAEETGASVYRYPPDFVEGGLLKPSMMQANSGVHLAWSASRFMRMDW